MFEFRWTIFLEVRNEFKATLVLRRIEDILGRTLNLYSLEKYWKIQSQWKARFVLQLNSKDKANAILKLYKIAGIYRVVYMFLRRELMKTAGLSFVDISQKTFPLLESNLLTFG